MRGLVALQSERMTELNPDPPTGLGGAAIGALVGDFPGGQKSFDAEREPSGKT